MNHLADIEFDEKNHRLLCIGSWTILNIAALQTKLEQLDLKNLPSLSISGTQLDALDSSGALALLKWQSKLKSFQDVTLIEFNDQHLDLINLIKEKRLIPIPTIPQKTKHSWLYRVGKESHEKLNQVTGLLYLIGDLTGKFLQACKNWKRFQATSIISNIDSTGLKALPIIALLSFLIGVVLAYQMGLQLQTYGANIYIAFLSGMAIFREFSPLITAIIVAGRTSSSFTAQLGSMKVNEEIDALYTMGLSPTELLVMPKVLGLLFVFPLLIFWSDVFSLMGAMIMSKFMLHVSYHDFLVRLKDAVGLKQLLLGLYKAPAFAILIALVGCFQGLRVEANASSIGHQTTKSVVQAIFLIIITDAIFSIVYSSLDL